MCSANVTVRNSAMTGAEMFSMDECTLWIPNVLISAAAGAIAISAWQPKILERSN